MQDPAKESILRRDEFLKRSFKKSAVYLFLKAS